jgi:hypothetical protein
MARRSKAAYCSNCDGAASHHKRGMGWSHAWGRYDPKLHCTCNPKCRCTKPAVVVRLEAEA